MSEVTMTGTRYRATFRPQAWIGDNAVEVDPEGETSWDATDFIASALASDEDRSWAERTIARGSDHDNVLRMDPAAPEWVREWRGPFDTDLEVVVPELRFALDVPNAYDAEAEWINYGYFETREEAVDAARHHFGADEEGRIGLVSELPADGEETP